MKQILHLTVFYILWTLPTIAFGENVIEPCFAENISARKISELPPEIKESIEDIFEEKLGDSDTVVRNTDFITPEVAKLPDARFHRGYKFRDKYIVFMQFPSGGTILHSFGYRAQYDGKYEIYPFPSYFFRGPTCPILTAIQNDVDNPNDYPEYFRKAILDEKYGNEKKM